MLNLDKKYLINLYTTPWCIFTA